MRCTRDGGREGREAAADGMLQVENKNGGFDLEERRRIAAYVFSLQRFP